jgi:hypothetical protein
MAIIGKQDRDTSLEETYKKSEKWIVGLLFLKGDGGEYFETCSFIYLLFDATPRGAGRHEAN